MTEMTRCRECSRLNVNIDLFASWPPLWAEVPTVWVVYRHGKIRVQNTTDSIVLWI